MGLAHRVIPTILCRGRTAYKGERFQSWRSIGLAAEKVRVHAMRGVDEVCLLDIGATAEGRGPDLGLVEELAQDLFIPFAVGGGIRTVADVRALLRAGADKVVIGTAAWINGDFVRRASDIAGSQAIVVTCDVVEALADVDDDRPGVRCMREVAAERVKFVVDQGAGEILLTSVDREGTLQGYDLELIRAVRKAVSVPIIAHGGAGTYQHMVEAIQAGASAVAAGAMFQFTDATPYAAAQYLHRNGIEARV